MNIDYLKGLKIMDSNIDKGGQGVFSVYNRAKGNIIGEGIHPTHVPDKRFKDAFMRTALGTFINHSDDPNCELVLIDEAYYLKTIKKIKVGDEMTIRYGQLDIHHEFFKMSPEQIKAHRERMRNEALSIIPMAELWVKVDDKESVRSLGFEILNGSAVLNVFDENIKKCLEWHVENGKGLQPKAAKDWLEKYTNKTTCYCGKPIDVKNPDAKALMVCAEHFENL